MESRLPAASMRKRYLEFFNSIFFEIDKNFVKFATDMEKEKLLTQIQSQRLERDAKLCDEFLRLKSMYSPVATSWGICKLVEKSMGVKRGVVAYVTKRAGIYR